MRFTSPNFRHLPRSYCTSSDAAANRFLRSWLRLSGADAPAKLTGAICSLLIYKRATGEARKSFPRSRYGQLSSRSRKWSWLDMVYSCQIHVDCFLSLYYPLGAYKLIVFLIFNSIFLTSGIKLDHLSVPQTIILLLRDRHSICPSPVLQNLLTTSPVITSRSQALPAHFTATLEHVYWGPRMQQTCLLSSFNLFLPCSISALIILN